MRTEHIAETDMTVSAAPGPLDQPESLESLRVMLSALQNDAHALFDYGRFRAKKKLPNGYVVTFTVQEPARRRRAKGAGR